MTERKTPASFKLPKGKYKVGVPPQYKGHRFLRWSDGEESIEREVVLDSDKTVTAIYEKEGLLSLYLGRIGEYKALGELLNRSLDVYIPIVDVRGIDCIVRLQSGEFREIQVKTRGTQKEGKEIFDVKSFRPRDNFFIVCYRRDLNVFWVLPSKVYKDHAQVKKDGKLRLRLGKKKQKELEDYKNNWSLIFKV
jgi:hypothetical protein